MARAAPAVKIRTAGHTHSRAPIVRLANIFAEYCAIEKCESKRFVRSAAEEKKNLCGKKWEIGLFSRLKWEEVGIPICVETWRGALIGLGADDLMTAIEFYLHTQGIMGRGVGHPQTHP